MNDAATAAWLRLVRCAGVGPVLGQRLLAHFGDPQTLFDAGPGAWRKLGLAEAPMAALQQPDEAGIATDLAWLDGSPRRQLLPLDDPRYPVRLKSLPHAPLALFALGDPDLLPLPQLAIVGSRAASPQGRANATAFAEALAQRGLTITSGLAAGIDGAAHEGALGAGGLTIAVCATGLDQVYPARHRALAHRIAEQGLLLSEFPVGVKPLPEHFPRRNRLISGLSLGVLVVEAAHGSGSLITARLAAEQGREVFAIPGSIHNPQARGCHQLIRLGAKLVESVDDILEELGPQVGPAWRQAQGEAPPSDTPEADTDPLLRALGDEALDVDSLLARVGGDLGRLASALLALELSGQVVQTGDGRYSAVRKPVV